MQHTCLLYGLLYRLCHSLHAKGPRQFASAKHRAPSNAQLPTPLSRIKKGSCTVAGRVMCWRMEMAPKCWLPATRPLQPRASWRAPWCTLRRARRQAGTPLPQRLRPPPPPAARQKQGAKRVHCCSHKHSNQTGWSTVHGAHARCTPGRQPSRPLRSKAPGSAAAQPRTSRTSLPRPSSSASFSTRPPGWSSPAAAASSRASCCGADGEVEQARVAV